MSTRPELRLVREDERSFIARPAGPSAWSSVGRGLWRLLVALLLPLRYLAFFVLLWFRGPIMLICEIAIMPLMLGGFVTAYLKGWTDVLTLLCFGFSFGAMVFAFAYDSLLLFLSPQDMMLF